MTVDPTQHWTSTSAEPFPPQRGRRLRAARVVVLAAALTLGGAGLATAGPSGDEPETTTLSESAQDSAQEYWSAERMEAATPAGELVEDLAATATEVVETAAPVEVPSVAGGTPPQTGTSHQEASEAAQPQAAPGDAAPAAVASNTDHIGKVFFTQGGVDYVCSGNAVASGNQATVATAGHCVHEAGSWATNWVFVPGYHEGETPYGLWSGAELFSTDQWVSSEDINYDVAFAVVEPESGDATLSETVGASGIAFNQERGGLYTSYGYPAAAPFDGQTLESCQGYGMDDTLGNTDDQGIECDMTGGSSGGPWFSGDGPDGYQTSVNSFGYSAQPGVMYGPYFGDAAQEVYAEAGAS
ncbi:trypsin-like serine peptidase [Brachybacterium sp. GCM10030267]|uniref:trypsin-like serine peptidase n=1 Tax=Brachybacterium sp. GCM10030267 TaxID=3273381 RepID=UPI0036217109